MDEYLSKWLDGNLTDEELIEQIGKKEAMKYIQIVSEVDNWVPDHSESLFDPKAITARPKAKVRTMRPWLGYAAAAIVLMSIASYFWILLGDDTVTYSSQIGEVREVMLPDGLSKVTLAPHSEISWETDEWEEAVAMMKESRLKVKKTSRNVRLRGKALFEVEKGAPFKVQSQTGSVEVLGTTFEVDDFEEGLNVICFEGKVLAKPKTGAKSVTVNGGVGYLFYEGEWGAKKDISATKPEWLQNQTKFENAPLSQVIKSLEKLYGITVEKGRVNTSRRFTGTIPNDNLEVALRIVFSPFKIEYSQEGKKVALSE